MAVAPHPRMTVEMALWMVGLVAAVFTASRVISRGRPAPQEQEEPVAPRSPLSRPHYEARHPQQFALPPVTIETLPINFKQMAEVAPPIDRGLLAALAASGSSAATRPNLARGTDAHASVSADASDLDDLDGAETLRPARDLDEDAMTRTHMSPVR
jgi:hypothetical protein